MPAPNLAVLLQGSGTQISLVKKKHFYYFNYEIYKFCFEVKDIFRTKKRLPSTAALLCMMPVFKSVLSR
jgi:hypothetical protein